MAKNTTLRNKPANNRVMATATHQTVTHYEGAIPHPEILRGFELQVPGSAARLIKQAEDESAHRRKLELMTIDANISAQQQQLDLGSQQTKSVFRSDLIGQISGLIVCLLAIVAAVFLGLEGHDGLAAIIAAIPTAAIIKAFTLNKK